MTNKCSSRRSRNCLPLALILLFGLPAGCAAPLKGTISAEAEESLRAKAMDFLKRAAFSDDPVLRMQAIEGLQEVAPEEGLTCIEKNLDNGYAGVCFAALMAVGGIGDDAAIEMIRLRAEDRDPSVRIAALYALHRLGDRSRTGELSELLLKHRDARVRANAALAIGRLGEPQSAELLQLALRREKKDAVKMQILEGLAMIGDAHGIDRLRLYGYSAVPDQSALALMLLANAYSAEAEDLFRYRLDVADQPEIKLQAARGLGRLGYDQGLDLALRYLFFDSPDRRRRNDSPEQQIIRIRALAALALESIGSRDALAALEQAMQSPGESDRILVAVARAIVAIVDGRQSRFDSPAERPSRAHAEHNARRNLASRPDPPP